MSLKGKRGDWFTVHGSGKTMFNQFSRVRIWTIKVIHVASQFTCDVLRRRQAPTLRTWIPIYLFSLLGLVFLASAARAVEVYLGVTKAEAQKIVIALAGIPGEGVPQELSRQAEAILASDLKFSRIFEVVEAPELPFEAGQLRLGDERPLLSKLTPLKIQALATGVLSSKGGNLILEGRLFDVTRGEMIAGKRYLGDAKRLRTMVHRWADEIVYRLTGEKGIASSRIAFVSTISGYKEIYIMDSDGSNPSLITGNRSLNLSPRFSPDGRSLAYISYRDGNPDIFLLDLETGRRQKLSSFPGLNISPAWSPDGNWIALSLSKDGGTNIYLMRKDGSELRKLTSGPGISVSITWSPSGRQIAFTSDRGGTPQIYVMDADGANVRRITWNGIYNASPRWSPRGDKIAFVSRQEGHFDIYIMNPDGAEVRQLTSKAGDNEDPTWSSDGRHIVFSSTRDGKKNLYVMDADGSNQRRLTHNGADNYNPDWSP
ncbi:MAG: Tol-Pal system beta propeller repeat protein TolB [candidate division NC10 bacterium]|nr:Tol-Pal system beta propeller repeat protein TolB [candidate division NC10 bacterium]